MAEKKKEKKHGTIEDFLEDVRGKHAKKLEDAFNHYEEFTKEENILHLSNNIFHPAHQDFYNTFTAELAKEFEDDTGKLHKKKDKVKKAAVAGLKKYFSRTMPGIAKAVDEIADIEDQYEFLVNAYDEHIGAGRMEHAVSLKGTLEGLMKDKKKTVGHLKASLRKSMEQNIENAMQMLFSKAHSHYFGTYHDHEIGAYVSGKIKEHPSLEIEDKVKYLGKKGHELVHLHQALVTGDFSNVNLEHFGIKYEKKKKHKDYNEKKTE